MKKKKTRHGGVLDTACEALEKGDIYSQRCWLYVTYCSSKAFLCSEKSSCLLPWCVECRRTGKWWTVGLWTTSSPLCSVSASLFCYSSLRLPLVSARGRQRCFLLLPPLLHLSVTGGRTFGSCFQSVSARNYACGSTLRFFILFVPMSKECNLEFKLWMCDALIDYHIALPYDIVLHYYQLVN